MTDSLGAYHVQVDPSRMASDADMEEVNRKRNAGAELGAKGAMPQQISETAETNTSSLAIVPVGLTGASPPPRRDLKRTKKTGEDSEDVISTVKNLAGSFEEHRRAQ